jgi:isoleucyl-tRNA synthetase
VPIRCESCGADVDRVTEVGDAWLDAGIVPFSTLGWENPEWVEGGYATGAAKGLSGADLPDHAYWEQWFPADWISEMREQIRLWFYAISFMSVTLVGRSPYRAVLTYEKLLDETGREMHRSWGNAIAANEALDRMGADVMRWLYCEQVPSQNMKFGYGPANDVKRRLLTLWNSVSFFVTYANIEGFEPRYRDIERGPDAELQPLDRWLVARTQALIADAEEAYERYWSPALTPIFEGFVDDLSKWYIRRSRRRFYSLDAAAFATLWYAIAQAVRVIGPVMPFLAEYLWQELVTRPCADAPGSVFLAGWPQRTAELADQALVDEVAQTRQVAGLGHQARQAAQLKVRQPLRRLVVQGAPLAHAHAEELADELRVKEVEFGEVEATELNVKPNLPLLGPKLGKELGKVREALAAGEFEELDDGGFRVAGHELSPDEVLVERRGREGWAVAGADGVTVALDTALDDELRVEGRVLDLIHRLNSMRKDAGFELTDRITVTLPATEADLLAHAEWIKSEVLAVEIDADGGGGEPSIAKA